jgi:glycosyltransferase involved in cell wall biosynthesis
MCPVHLPAPEPAEKLIGLDPRIEIVDIETAPRDVLRRHVAEADVLQVPGNATWAGSAQARALIQIARSLRKPTIVGISSNRAKTALMNASRSGWLERIRARLQYLSIRASQIHLASRASGVFVVGEGLRSLVGRWNPNIHVGTASWIRDADILAPRQGGLAATVRLCAAARLERMKGIHLAIEAMPLMATLPGVAFELLVAGTGPEEAALRQLAQGADATSRVSFIGTLGYPEAFLALLRTIDFVLLTNLNDEQPRVLFDAISQGCIPICPDSRPYRSLKLPGAVFYRHGDARSLAETLLALVSQQDLSELRSELEATVRAFTIESMHRSRRRWVELHVLVR